MYQTSSFLTVMPYSQAVEKNGLMTDTSHGLKTYQLGDGTSVNILYDNATGVFGKITQGLNETLIPFYEIEGIPSKIRFSTKDLSYFLEETYIHLRRDRLNDEITSLSICQRGFGGFKIHFRGLKTTIDLKNSKNNTNAPATSSTTSSPPPQEPKKIIYGAGFAIKRIEVWNEEQKKLIDLSEAHQDKKTYEVSYPAEVADGKTLVKIWVLKREHFADKVRVLLATKNELLVKCTNNVRQNASLNRTIKQVESLQLQITKTQQDYQNTQEEIGRINLELVQLNKENNDHLAKQAEISEHLSFNGKTIRPLITLFDLIDRLQISFFQSLPPPLIQMKSRDKSIDLALGKEIDENHFLQKAVKAIGTVLENSQKAHGLDVYALLGNTGVGKSTAVNFLLGKKMIEVDEEVYVAEEEKEIAKIGRRVSTSETLTTQVYLAEKKSYAFADCGGFSDTRGIKADLTVVASLKATLEQAKRVKILLCIPARLIAADKGIYFKDVLNQALAILKNQDEAAKSILLMVTKPHLRGNGKLYSTADAINEIQKLAAEWPDGLHKKLCTTLLRNGGTAVAVCNPLSEDSKKEILQKFDVIDFIPKPQTAFQISYSSQSQFQLLDQMISVAQLANQLYEDCKKNKRLQAQLAVKKRKVEEHRSTFTTRGETHKTLLETLKKNLAEFEPIDNLNRKATQLQQELTAEKLKIEAIDNEVKTYNSDGFIIYESAGGEWNTRE